MAIDFTASNGLKDDSKCLHHEDQKKNQYLNALRQVGNILQYYDSSKAIPAYGFGCKIAGHDTPCHKFALNGDIFNPECDGIKGLELAYRKVVGVCDFYGPTNFSQILEAVNNRVESQYITQEDQQYNVLLILTDGIVDDLDETIDEIVRGSKLNLSIIIVGIGNANFKAMD